MASILHWYESLLKGLCSYFWIFKLEQPFEGRPTVSKCNFYMPCTWKTENKFKIIKKRIHKVSLHKRMKEPTPRVEKWIYQKRIRKDYTRKIIREKITAVFEIQAKQKKQKLIRIEGKRAVPFNVHCKLENS